jgi:hypothetical protein
MCFFGEISQPRSTMVLFGDSHAAQWFPALLQIANVQHWRLATIIKPGCTALSIREETTPRMERVCGEWRRAAFEDMEQLRPELVIVTSASRHPGAEGKMVEDARIWEKGLETHLRH